MIRRARPLSADWVEDASAYFGCWRCGLRLAELSGASALRPSDLPLDHVPDPVGFLRLMLHDPTVMGFIGGTQDGDTPAGNVLNADYLYPGLRLKSFSRRAGAEGQKDEPGVLAEFRSRPLLAILAGPGDDLDRLVRSGWVEAAFLMGDQGNGRLEVVDSIVRPKDFG